MSVEIKNQDVFGKVIANAIAKVNEASLQTYEKIRWINAIARGVALIEDQPEWIEWHPELDMITVWNQETNKVYNANGVCECEASRRGYCCKHRAAKQLIKNYFAELEKPENAPALDTPPTASSLASRDKDVPYLKMPTGRQPERVGNYRI